MTHFTEIEMRRWRDVGPGEDRDRVVAHLAECAECATRYAAAIREKPLTADEASDADQFVAAGRRAAVVRAAWHRRWTIPLAAAALLALAIAVPRLMRHDVEEAPTLRGAAIHALAPDGAVDREPIEFVWSSGVSAPRFRIDVRDADHVVYSTETAGSRYALPPDERAKLRPGIEYSWEVAALDAGGTTVATSERRTFTLPAR